MRDDPPPVFLIGAQRSGTTALAHLLSALFAREGGLFTVNGKLFYYLQRWLSDEDVRSRHFRSDEILHGLARLPPGGVGIEGWKVAVEQELEAAAARIAQGLGSEPTAVARQVVSRTYGRWPRWGEKYNELVFSIPYLNALCPEARYVLLFRHPSAVVRSHLAWSGHRPWNPRTGDAALRKWMQWNRRAMDDLAALGDERLLALEYDDLCGRPDVAERLERFLGLPGCAALIGRSYRTTRARDEGVTLPGDAADVLDQLRRLASR